MKKQPARRALGRGLSNLIPTHIDGDDSSNNGEICLLDISSIKTNPFQPRVDFNEEEIKNLAQSIENQGLLQPVVVRQKDSHYEIISGERRFRAFNYLKREKLPCIIKTKVTDREMLELALVENIQREELNEIEKAIAFQKLLLEFNYTHEELSKRVGKSRTAITNSLRLLNLPEEIQQMVRQEKITMGHARALLALENEKDQLQLAHRIESEHLSVRDIEKESKEIKEKKSPKTSYKKKIETLDPDIANILERLQYKFGTAVKIKPSSENVGKLEIDYYNQSDLIRIVDLLLA
jgi:ParB family chromosome partitioning protein